MKITNELLRDAATKRGGYTKAQISFAQSIVGSKWKRGFLSNDITVEQWDKFKGLGSRYKKQATPKPPKKLINPLPVNKKNDWSWNPQKSDIPSLKIKSSKNSKYRGVKKAKRDALSKLDDAIFYTSDAWRMLRVRVLEKYQCKCMMCGRSPKLHGIVIHVDHIKPRSKYPDLSLEFENLQLLCEDCNIGKSNRYETDWRPEFIDEITKELDYKMLESIPMCF